MASSKMLSQKDKNYRPTSYNNYQFNNLRQIIRSRSELNDRPRRIVTSDEYIQRQDILENQINTVRHQTDKLHKLREISDSSLNEEHVKVIDQSKQFYNKLNREINRQIQRIHEKCQTMVSFSKKNTDVYWTFRVDGLMETIEELQMEIKEIQRLPFSEKNAMKLEIMECKIQKEASILEVLNDMVKHENQNNRVLFRPNFKNIFIETLAVLEKLSVKVILHEKEIRHVDSVVQHRQPTHDINQKQFLEKRVIDLRQISKELRDCVILNDGELVFTDYGHNRLILYSKIGNMSKFVCLRGNPFALTAIEDRTIAISYYDLKTVEIIHVDTKKILCDFRFDMNCAGISYHDGKLVVRIERYGYHIIDLVSRQILHEVRMEGGTMPYVSHIDGRFFCANWKTGKVSCCLIDGKQLWEFRNEILINPNGITADSIGNVFVCGYGSNNIIAISRDGLVAKQLDTFINTINAPLGIHFSKESDELLITNKGGYATLYSVCSLTKDENAQFLK